MTSKFIIQWLILWMFISVTVLAWAQIYILRDQIQTLRNENDLMVSEIEHNAKLLTEMESRLYPAKVMYGK